MEKIKMSSLIIDVCKILEIKNHPNADKLDVALVKGWQVIIQKNQYNVGDLVVFIPPDSVLPPQMIAEYGLDYLKSNSRVGSVKLRGVISQGLVISAPPKAKIGDNVANYFGISKYEVPEPSISLGGNILPKKKLNPLFDRYTDIENIKNFPNVFSDTELVVFTEKLHGCNARFGNLEIKISPSSPFMYKVRGLVSKFIFGKTHEFVYGSHNVQKSGTNGNHFYGTDVWGAIAKRHDLANKLPKNYIFYGEIVGNKIQDLDYGFIEPELFIFDIKNVITGEYLDWEDILIWCNMLDLNIVPLYSVEPFSSDTLKKWTSGSSYLASHIREGVVVKPYQEKYSNGLGRKILKSINPEYTFRKNGTEFK